MTYCFFSNVSWIRSHGYKMLEIDDFLPKIVIENCSTSPTFVPVPFYNRLLKKVINHIFHMNAPRIPFFISFVLWLWLGPLVAQVDQLNYRGWVRTKNTEGPKKLALVIGNSEYQYSTRLIEPANDAERIASALESQGYEVELGYNLGRTAFNEAIETFANKFRNYHSGIIYYAGHGFQIDGENYLIPVDANPASKYQVHSQCINVDYFFRAINQPDKAKVIILDACRNNPFVKSRNWTSEVRGETKGMTDISPMTNSLIIFSTEKNTVVKDNNPFTELLSDYIERGGCMNSILGKVSREVRTIDPTQRILPEGLLEEDICFGSSTNEEGAGTNLVDTDKDLIPDKIDKCPNEPGSLENNGCPGEPKESKQTLDGDNDGLVDTKDNCPTTAGPIENGGCPEELYQGPFDQGTFKDARDGTQYKWVRLRDGRKWMGQNLNFKMANSWCYDNKNKNCQQFGRLYTWDAAQRACPKGWKLPSKYEWKRLIEIYGGVQAAYQALLMEQIHEFSPVLAGGRKPEKDFCCKGDFGNYWSSENTAAHAVYIDFNKPNGTVNTEQYGKNWALSCRCIQEK